MDPFQKLKNRYKWTMVSLSGLYLLVAILVFVLHPTHLGNRTQSDPTLMAIWCGLFGFHFLLQSKPGFQAKNSKLDFALQLGSFQSILSMVLLIMLAPAILQPFVALLLGGSAILTYGIVYSWASSQLKKLDPDSKAYVNPDLQEYMREHGYLEK